MEETELETDWQERLIQKHSKEQKFKNWVNGYKRRSINWWIKIGVILGLPTGIVIAVILMRIFL